MPILSGPQPLFDDALIRPAQPGEEETVLDVLAEAAAWLAGRGIAQWPQRFPADSVRAQIASKEALLVEQDAQPIATFAVAEGDPDLWGTPAEPAYYISRLAVVRRASGANLGYHIINWVAAQAVEHGLRYVRLATSKDNPALRHYYEQVGFQHVADPTDTRWPTSLYQRDARGANHPVTPTTPSG
jgi:GNAT superfamily N-acetyltransferase